MDYRINFSESKYEKLAKQIIKQKLKCFRKFAGRFSFTSLKIKYLARMKNNTERD